MMRRFPRRARRSDASGGKRDLDRATRAGGGAERLRIEVSDGPRSARMALYGEFDIACADDAGRALQELLRRGLDAVVIDLSGLDFMDSTGVKFLVDGRDTARALGVRLTLVHGGEPVQRVLTVSGVTALFEDVDNRHSSP
jgi:anti-sigma B factor antagonist